MDGTRDLLTGILSRETMIDFITKELKKDKEIAVALADVDFFVNIDSKVGKDEGDNILKKIAEFLSSYEDFTVGRYGGDEFILAFQGKGKEESLELLDTLRKKFRRQRFISQDSIYCKVPMTVSLGLATKNGKINDTGLLLKSAEIALAMAKKMGRNRVAVAPKDDICIIEDKSADISTVIGGGLRGYEGDKGHALKAKLLEPYGVDIVNEDEIIFADRGNHVIRKIRKDYIIETIAGSGEYGHFGDKEGSREARLNKPSGVAVDDKGQIFIADTGNHCIRKIDEKGVISTFAGCGKDGYEGDGGKSDYAKLSRPGGVVVDSLGNVYTNDYGNNVIRMISKDRIISTIAGSGQFGYSGDGGNPLDAAIDKPYGLAVTSDGDFVFIADYGNHCIRKVDMKRKIITTVCGTGEPGYSGDGDEARKAKINEPFWVSPWLNKYLLIADGGNHCIRIVNLATNKIDTLIGNGKPGYRDGKDINQQIAINIPAGMVVDSKNNLLYIADYGNNAIRKLDLNKTSYGC